MSQGHTTKGPLLRPADQGGNYVQFELSLGSEVSAISPFVDTLMGLIRKSRWVHGSEEEIEIALREALVNAVVHDNHEDPGKQVLLVVTLGLTRSPSSSETKDKDMTLANSQTLPLQETSAPATAVAST